MGYVIGEIKVKLPISKTMYCFTIIMDDITIDVYIEMLRNKSASCN
jgi:hypothetical protein